MVYRVYMVSLKTEAILCRCDFFELPKMRPVNDAMNRYISEHPLSTIPSLATGHHVVEAQFMITIGSTQSVRCFIFSQVGSYPLDAIAYRFCVLLQSDPDCRIIVNSPAGEPTKHPCLKRFRKVIYFELINFYFHLVPSILGDVSRISRQDRDMAISIQPYVDGKRCLGEICQLLTVSNLRSSWIFWKNVVTPDDSKLQEYLPMIKSWCSNSHWSHPITLIERVGDIVIFFIKYSVSIGVSRPFIDIRNSVFSYDVFITKEPVYERAKLSAIEKCCHDLSRPVYAEVIEMVLEKFDGFSTIREIEFNVPLPSSLVREIAEVLIDHRLIERPVLIPRKTTHDWQNAQENGEVSEESIRTYRLFDGELCLEKIAMFSGVHIAQVMECTQDKAVSIEKLSWNTFDRRDRLTRIKSSSNRTQHA